MVLYLSEDDIEQLLTMADAIEVVQDSFKQQGNRNIINNPRQRVCTGKSMLHYMAGALPHLGVMGYKAYTSSKKGLMFRVFLHDMDNGELLSVMDGNYMGMIRTGAVTGVATRFMSREDSSSLGVFGTGFQSVGQIMAVCKVRDITRIRIYGRDEERRIKFCGHMSEMLNMEVTPVSKPNDVLSDSDIVITSTSSSEPVFDGNFVERGTHINAIGGNFVFKREIDETTISKSDVISVESVEQCRFEAGELIPSIEKGRLHWDDLIELGYIVAGKEKGRNKTDEVTLFKSVGIAMEDICIAKHLYDMAGKTNTGRNLDIPSI